MPVELAMWALGKLEGHANKDGNVLLLVLFIKKEVWFPFAIYHGGRARRRSTCGDTLKLASSRKQEGGKYLEPTARQGFPPGGKTEPELHSRLSLVFLKNKQRSLNFTQRILSI